MSFLAAITAGVVAFVAKAYAMQYYGYVDADAFTFICNDLSIRRPARSSPDSLGPITLRDNISRVDIFIVKVRIGVLQW